MSDTLGLFVGIYLAYGTFLSLKTLPPVIEATEAEYEVTIPFYFKVWMWFIGITWWAPIILRGYYRRHIDR